MLHLIFRNSLAALLLVTAPFISGQAASAQTPDPVHWSIAARSAPVLAGDTVSIMVSVVIDAGFHVYSLNPIEDGPYPLVIKIVEDDSFKAAGAVKGSKPEKIATSSFGIPVEWYSKKAAFTVPVRIAVTSAASALARISIRYQSCSSTVCLLPKTVELTQSFALRSRTSH